MGYVIKGIPEYLGSLETTASGDVVLSKSLTTPLHEIDTIIKPE
jgi:hypothetical protein